MTDQNAEDFLQNGTKEEHNQDKMKKESSKDRVTKGMKTL